MLERLTNYTHRALCIAERIATVPFIASIQVGGGSSVNKQVRLACSR